MNKQYAVMFEHISEMYEATIKVWAETAESAIAKARKLMLNGEASAWVCVGVDRC
jgi:hypothetical protein